MFTFCEQIVFNNAVNYVEHINFIDYALSREYLVFRLARSVEHLSIKSEHKINLFTIVKVSVCEALQ